MSLSILFPAEHYEIEIEARDDVMALAEELAALGDEESAMQADRGYQKPHAHLEITDVNARSVARALDHLRNQHRVPFEEIETAPSHRHLNDARDALLTRLGMSPLTYRLRSWEFGGKDETFWSYTGQYEAGDRMVAAPDEVFTVVSVEKPATPVDDGVLVVERLRRR